MKYLFKEIIELISNKRAKQLEKNKNINLYKEVILYQTYNDYLTNTQNRLAFIKKLSEKFNLCEKDKNYKAAVLSIDIDDFKRVNDVFGYETGDKVLIWIAEKLKKAIKKQEALFRIGSDEFAIILEEYKDLQELDKRIEDALNNLNGPVSIDGITIQLTLSIGIALFPDNGNNIGELLRNADIAMYTSKIFGKNKYSHYSKSMNDKMLIDMNKEINLMNAVTKNQFILYYQPQININSNKVYGLEALIRWKHPELGIVSPEYFIDVLESNGMIKNVGKFVVAEACNKLLKLKKEGFNDLVMSVNISVKQLEDRLFLNFFEKTLENMGVEGKDIHIEITERILLNPSETVLNTLISIRKKGIKIFIDDFGTGYSSLNYLFNFPIDGIKIDRVFVKDIISNRRKLIVLKNIIRLCNELELLIIIEGVEEKEQLNCLKELNCDIIQGFIFSKPVGDNEITDTIKRFI